MSIYKELTSSSRFRALLHMQRLRHPFQVIMVATFRLAALSGRDSHSPLATLLNAPWQVGSGTVPATSQLAGVLTAHGFRVEAQPFC